MKFYHPRKAIVLGEIAGAHRELISRLARNDKLGKQFIKPLRRGNWIVWLARWIWS